MATKPTPTFELTEEQLERIVATAAAAAVGAVQVKTRQPGPPREIKVVVNEGDAVQYGAVTIAKANGNGTFLPRVGIAGKDLDYVIKALQAAKRTLKG